MRVRLLLVLALLAAITTMSFAVPLALSTADARTRQFVQSRDADLQRFAVFAEEAVTGDLSGPLRGELEAYHELYGEPVAVVSTRGEESLSVGLDLDSPDVMEAIARAVRNQPAPTPDRLTPWAQDSVVFAQPIGTEAQVDGAAVLIGSTAAATTDIGRAWLLIAAGSVGTLLVFGAIAHGVSRWILRPVNNLSTQVDELTRSLPLIGGARAPRDSPLSGQGPPELRALARSVDTMSASVAASTAAQQRLVADAAHQLRNPLAALQLRLDTVQDLAGAELGPLVGHAATEAERLDGILGELLMLAKAETPQGRSQSCDAAAVCAERVGFWRPIADDAAVALDLVPAARELPVAMSRSALEQCLDVLLDNACKYAVRASVKVTARTHHPPGGPAAAIVAVADSGPGVGEEDLPRLAERFFRGASSSDRGGEGRSGTGLGLAIVAALAENIGGSLRFGTTPGGGLTAELTIPLADSVEEGTR